MERLNLGKLLIEYDGSRPSLAFSSIGGRCLPKADFLSLLDYLESHSDIEQHKKK
jgi:chromosome partitioning protein